MNKQKPLIVAFLHIFASNALLLRKSEYNKVIPTGIEIKNMTYNFNKIKRTSKMFTFADDSRLRVVRVSQKGEQTK